MKALTWHGKSDMRCESGPDPKIEHPRDAIIKVTACAICGSDLHIFDGVIPGMKSGDVLGHETMGEVVEVGAENKKLKVGDRVVVPFTISCGEPSSASAANIRRASAAILITRRRRSCGAIRRPACSATPTCWAAMPAVRQSIYACPMLMSDRSRCRRV
jgi:threonine dehydrogenase-like Zn-dependent dehydrogenase